MDAAVLNNRIESRNSIANKQMIEVVDELIEIIRKEKVEV